MIIKYNLLYHTHSRLMRSAWFYHWRGNPPTDQQVVDVLAEYLLIDGFSIRDNPTLGQHHIPIMYCGKLWGEAWSIFPVYNDGELTGEWADLEWKNGWYRDEPTKHILGK